MKKMNTELLDSVISKVTGDEEEKKKVTRMFIRLRAARTLIHEGTEAGKRHGVGDLFGTLEKIGVPPMVIGSYIGIAWVLDGCPGMSDEDREELMNTSQVEKIAEICRAYKEGDSDV